MPIHLMDHEQRFADSPRGAMLIARAKRDHDMREAHRGANARPWTDAMEAAATRTLATSEARSTVITDAAKPMQEVLAATSRVMRDAALVARKDRMRNAWKDGK